MKHRTTYSIMLTGSVIGMVAAFLQTTEKIALLKNKGAVLTCDLNSVFSCTNVLNAWQSSVFGFPNSLMCLVLFTIFASTALVGASGGVLPRVLRLSVQGLSLFTLLFALWSWRRVFTSLMRCVSCVFSVLADCCSLTGGGCALTSPTCPLASAAAGVNC